METRTFTIELSKEDFEILDRYGFFFEKNFEEQAKSVANQLRECEKEVQE